MCLAQCDGFDILNGWKGLGKGANFAHIVGCQVAFREAELADICPSPSEELPLVSDAPIVIATTTGVYDFFRVQASCSD